MGPHSLLPRGIRGVGMECFQLMRLLCQGMNQHRAQRLLTRGGQCSPLPGYLFQRPGVESHALLLGLTPMPLLR